MTPQRSGHGWRVVHMDDAGEVLAMVWATTPCEVLRQGEKAAQSSARVLSYKALLAEEDDMPLPMAWT